MSRIYNSLNEGGFSLASRTAKAAAAGQNECALTRIVPSGGTTVAGAPPSNTAPANYIPVSNVGVTILRQGVDSLYLSYPGKLHVEWDEKLRDLKNDARNDDEAIKALAQVPIGDHLLEVRDHGSGHYPYILVDNCYSISLSGNQSRRLPLAHVQIKSECLTALSISAAESNLSSIIKEVGQIEGSTLTSRADLFVDFTTTHTITECSPSAWVTRAHKIGFHTIKRQHSGWTIGLGGHLAARLYDKTLELKRSHKDYLKALWAQAGWEEGLTVWRLEFQFRRTVLKELGAGYFEDLQGLLGPLWRYASTQWLRLTLPNPDDTNQSRWATHPLWQVLSELTWEADKGIYLERLRKDRAPSDRSLFINGLAGITSFMAREGIQDIEEGIKKYLQHAEIYHRHISPTRDQNLATYVDKKVRAKGRRFNTINNHNSEEGQRNERIAQATRQRPDGQ